MDGERESDPEGDFATIEAQIDAARSGNPRAVELLYSHYRTEVISYVSRSMGPRARRWSDPEDLAEEVLIAVLGRPAALPEGVDEGALRARLRRTASNRIKDHVRKHSSRDGISAVGPGREVEGVEQHSVTRRENEAVLGGLIDRLPREYREIVRLCGLDELSYAEVARRLGMNQDTVRKRYERARQVLAQKLSARGYEF